MKILEEIMDKPPIISQDESHAAKRLAIALGRGDSCTLDCDADFSTVLSIIILAGLEVLDGSA